MGKPIKNGGKEYGYTYWVYLSKDVDFDIISELEKSRNQSSDIRSALRIKYGTLNKPIEETSCWEMKQIDNTHYHYVCKHCKAVSKYRKTPYCPMCGYLMLNSEMKEKK